MAFNPKDGVQETSTFTGTGNLSLAGKTSGSRPWSAIGDTNVAVAYIKHATADEAEWCWVAYNSGGNTLTRGTFIASTTGSRVDFSAGEKTVSLVAVVGNLVMMNADGDATVTRHLAVGGNLTVGNSAPEARLLNTGNNQGWTMFNWSAANDVWALAFLTGGTWAGNVLFANRDYTFGVGRNPFGTAYGLDVSCVAARFGDGSTGYTFLQYGMSATAGNNWHVGSVGDGTFRFYTGTHGAGTEQYRLSATALLPADDNVKTAGDGSHRFSVFYAGTGTINTSGADAKVGIREPSDAERRAARRILDIGPKLYRFKDAYDAKGEAARLHAGYIAEDVRDALAAEDLDPWTYGFMCADPVMVRESYTETVTRAKKRPVEGATESVVEMRDGRPVLVAKPVERWEPVGAFVDVVDEAGKTVMAPTGEKDDKGNPVLRPMQHFVPELETVEEERTREVPLLDGDGQPVMRLGLRYSELEAFLRCAD